MTEQSTARVECYSGHTYAQEPRVVVWQGRRLPVTRIERRWRTPEGPAFSVDTEQGLSLELHYNEIADIWTIQPHTDLGEEAVDPAGRAQDIPDINNRHNYEDKEVL